MGDAITEFARKIAEIQNQNRASVESNYQAYRKRAKDNLRTARKFQAQLRRMKEVDPSQIETSLREEIQESSLVVRRTRNGKDYIAMPMDTKIGAFQFRGEVRTYTDLQIHWIGGPVNPKTDEVMSGRFTPPHFYCVTPHSGRVRAHDICLGTAKRPVGDALKKGQLVQAFALVRQILESPPDVDPQPHNTGAMFIALVKCVCGTVYSKSQFRTCPYCQLTECEGIYDESYTTKKNESKNPQIPPQENNSVTSGTTTVTMPRVCFFGCTHDNLNLQPMRRVDDNRTEGPMVDVCDNCREIAAYCENCHNISIPDLLHSINEAWMCDTCSDEFQSCEQCEVYTLMEDCVWTDEDTIGESFAFCGNDCLLAFVTGRQRQ